MRATGSRWRLVQGLALGLVLFSLSAATVLAACSLAACHRAAADPAASPTVEAMATLTVRAQVRRLSGAAPAPWLPTPSPQSSPAVGATAAVLDAAPAQQVLAEQVVDDEGMAVFRLPAGRYGVVMPHDPRLLAGAIVLPDQLPDGRAIVAQQEVTLGIGESVEVTLSATLPLP
jgi:hypothetical protein